jgi:hypothetical protein
MPLLSHYTTRVGLEKIARTETLWATNFLDLNDETEFFYGFGSLSNAAIHMVMGLIPDENRRKVNDLETESVKAVKELRQRQRSTDGYGQLYVVSFARGRTDYENKSGIRTLWELYGHHHEGYCLQFDEDDVRRILRLDSERSNYEAVGMTEVKYGVDENEPAYRDLCFQLSQQILELVFHTRPDIEVQPEWERMWTLNDFYRKLMWYCATHKHPCFVDEREMRIFAYPSASSDARVFTGTATKKRVRTCPRGRKYIVLGENLRPGLIPRRIIVGTKADRAIDSIRADYFPLPGSDPIFNCSLMPEVAYANMPIA